MLAVSKLYGKIHPAPGKRDLWVKVVPVIGTPGGEAKVDADGSFQIAGMDGGGDFLLLVLDGQRHHQVVDQRLEHNLRVGLPGPIEERERENVAKTIQIRNVPDALANQLKARARAEGLSLSAYIRRELEPLAQPLPPSTTMTFAEWLENTRQLQQPIRSTKSSAQIIRELRGN